MSKVFAIAIGVIIIPYRQHIKSPTTIPFHKNPNFEKSVYVPFFF